MHSRPLIALLMGLVIQLSQVQWHAAPATPESCGAKPMSCCDGLRSCPCANRGEPEEKPVPLLPAGADLKFFVSKPSAPDRMEARATAGLPEKAMGFSRPAPTPGYAGVPLSVAFCTFVI